MFLRKLPLPFDYPSKCQTQPLWDGVPQRMLIQVIARSPVKGGTTKQSSNSRQIASACLDLRLAMTCARRRKMPCFMAKNRRGIPAETPPTRLAPASAERAGSLESTEIRDGRTNLNARSNLPTSTSLGSRTADYAAAAGGLLVLLMTSSRKALS